MGGGRLGQGGRRVGGRIEVGGGRVGVLRGQVAKMCHDDMMHQLVRTGLGAVSPPSHSVAG